MEYPVDRRRLDAGAQTTLDAWAQALPALLRKHGAEADMKTAAQDAELSPLCAARMDEKVWAQGQSDLRINLLVCFFFEKSQQFPPAPTYPEMEPFLQRYPALADAPPQEADLLWRFANWLCFIMHDMPGRGNKTILLNVCAKLSEGGHAHYVTGSGATQRTKDRVAIIEQEGHIKRWYRSRPVDQREEHQVRIHQEHEERERLRKLKKEQRAAAASLRKQQRQQQQQQQQHEQPVDDQSQLPMTVLQEQQQELYVTLPGGSAQAASAAAAAAAATSASTTDSWESNSLSRMSAGSTEHEDLSDDELDLLHSVLEMASSTGSPEVDNGAQGSPGGFSLEEDIANAFAMVESTLMVEDDTSPYNVPTGCDEAEEAAQPCDEDTTSTNTSMCSPAPPVPEGFRLPEPTVAEMVVGNSFNGPAQPAVSNNSAHSTYGWGCGHLVPPTPAGAAVANFAGGFAAPGYGAVDGSSAIATGSATSFF